MKNIEFFFVSSFLICKVHSDDTYFMQEPMNSIKRVKEIIEKLCEDLKK